MNRFCQNCGKEAQPNHKVCIHCGTSLLKQERVAKNEQQSVKKPMSKKQKVIWGIVVGIAVFIFGFSMWANSYQSASAVNDRFLAAVTDKDSKKLTKLMVHEDGSKISEQEAEAFLKLIKKEGKRAAKDYYTIVQHGKFIGIYDANKVEVVDQFAYYDDLVEGLAFQFNGKKMTEHDKDKASVVYGPLAPGIYSVEAVFDGKYGKTTKKDKLTLNRTDRDNETFIDMNIPVAKVTFHVNNYNQFDPKKAYIQLNDEKISLDDEGRTKEIGPLIINGSQEITTVVEMPWGEVTSEPIKVDSDYLEIPADLLNEEQYTALKETIKDFGEQYVKVLAEKSTKPLKVVSADVKEEVKGNITESYYYTGKLMNIGIDKSSIQVNQTAKEPSVQLLTEYQFEEGFHDLSETPELNETNNIWLLGLNYDKEAKKWLVNTWEDTWASIEVTDTIKGSKKLHGPSDKAIANAKAKELESELEDFIYEYTYASVEAINYRDFDLVSDYITADGPRRKEARDYIDYLDEEGIYEQLLNQELEKVEKVDDNSWKVTVVEDYTIEYPDDYKDKKFRTVVIVKEIDDEFYVDELVATDPI